MKLEALSFLYSPKLTPARTFVGLAGNFNVLLVDYSPHVHSHLNCIQPVRPLLRKAYLNLSQRVAVLALSICHLTIL